MNKRLTIDHIEKSQEIQNWLTQFSAYDKPIAKELLCKLRFVTRDEYSAWLLDALSLFLPMSRCAIYSVRKFEETPASQENETNLDSLWLDNGDCIQRPAHTQGSEDFVSSIISQANKRYNHAFLDSPSLNQLKVNKIRDIILVDDSIGSGKRVSSFIRRMTNNKTFKSWWSFGFIKIHILSYARTYQAEKGIVKNTAGSDHWKRANRVSNKISFVSLRTYDIFDDTHNRWGEMSKEILSLCDSYTKPNYPRGYGKVMGNYIFFHSVPNNIPGMLFSSANGWKPLFPRRCFPQWLENLLNDNYCTLNNMEVNTSNLKRSEDLIQLLQYIKSGVRRMYSLSRCLCYDTKIVKELVHYAIRLGFISSEMRLQKPGNDYLKKNMNKNRNHYNFSLYSPQSWCVDQGSIQPCVEKDTIHSKQMDGDSRMLSLERTDAMATFVAPKGCAATSFDVSEATHPSRPHGLKVK